MIRHVIQIADMHCAMCSMTIDGVLEDIPGVKEADTSFVHGRAEVVFDPDEISLDELVAAIRAAGYDVRPGK